jgi:branched-chain amino acid transport system permease protein
MKEFLQLVVDAASLGSLDTLLALGIAVIFGVGRIVNFAYGEFIMVGCYVLFLVAAWVWPLAIIVTIVAVVVLALLSERIAFRPLRGADVTTALVASFALSAFLQQLVTLIAGSTSKGVNFGSSLTGEVDILGLRVPKLELVTVGVTLFLLLCLVAFFTRTSAGIQLRAAAEDFGMARLLGVRAHLAAALAFAISGVLAGVAAILLTIQTGVVSPSLGLNPVLAGLVGAVLGGLGSLVGACIGGFALGTLTVILGRVLPAGLDPYRDAFVFGLVIVVLVFRPQGIVPTSALTERV